MPEHLAADSNRHLDLHLSSPTPALPGPSPCVSSASPLYARRTPMAIPAERSVIFFTFVRSTVERAFAFHKCSPSRDDAQ